MDNINAKQLNRALSLVGEYLESEGLPAFHLVICGGAALIAASFVVRTTADVDVVALIDEHEQLISPDPLPPEILRAADFVGKALSLPEDWLNNGPSHHPGGLFQTGLPKGLHGRLTRQNFGSKLSVHFLSRYDQIHLKLYAAVDAGMGRHVTDLLELKPTEPEVEAAGRWAMTHDVSEGFRTMLVSMLNQLGFEHVAQRL